MTQAMWESFCETLRQCGRNAAAFVLLMLLIAGCGIIPQGFGWVILPALLVFCLVRILWFWWRQSRVGRLEKFPPLSQNEREVARSKLLRMRNLR